MKRRVRALVVALVASATGLSAQSAHAQNFARALVGGNFNGANEASQSWDELVVGSPDFNFWSGVVYVYVRNGQVLWDPATSVFSPRTAFSVYRFDQSYFGGSEGDVAGADFFGSVLAVGDFNADGKKDLAIGVPGEDVGDKIDAGCVHVLFGASNSGTRWPFNGKVTITRDMTFPTDGLIAVPQADDRFGAALAVGDFDGNGMQDLAVGAPGATVGGKAGAGAVFVFHAAGNGSNVFSAPQEYTLSAGGSYTGGSSFAAPAVNAGFGSALAAGNFNSDVNAASLQKHPYTDLAIGAPGETVSGATNAGRVFIVHGSSTHIGNSKGPQLWSQANVPGADGGAESNDRFGATLFAGNFNRGGSTTEDKTKSFDDLAVGSPGESLTNAGTNYSGAGLVQVLYGFRNGLQTTAAPATDADVSYSQASQTFNHASITGSGAWQSSMSFGATLTGGDIMTDNGGCQGNACNPVDLVVGEPGYNSEAGRAYVIDGKGLNVGLTLSGAAVLASASPASFARYSSALASLQLGLGRSQPDGFGGRAMDLVVGSPLEGPGAAYAYFGYASNFAGSNLNNNIFTPPSGLAAPPF